MASVVTVDSSWLSAHGNSGHAPWVLNANNTIYRLAADVDDTGSYGGGELFKLTGVDTYLDKNGHFIRYNGKDISQRTRSGQRPVGPASENEVEVTQGTDVDNIGDKGATRDTTAKVQDDADRESSNTGGRDSTRETTTSDSEPYPYPWRHK